MEELVFWGLGYDYNLLSTPVSLALFTSWLLTLVQSGFILNLVVMVRVNQSRQLKDEETHFVDQRGFLVGSSPYNTAIRSIVNVKIMSRAGLHV